MKFKRISEIDITNKNWVDQIYITIDVDWASDEVLDDTLNLFIKNKTKATILLTHKTKLIKKITENPLFDIGIHPNFNYLLNGDNRYGENYEEVIDYYLSIVPNSKIVRSHSVTQNTYILDYLKKKGLKFDLNTEIPYSSKINLKPYRDWTGLIKAPYFWQENISFKYKWELNHKNFIKNKSLKIFNFHPIHIYLNSECMERYENSKLFHKNISKLKSLININNYGIRNFLIDLLNENQS